VNPPSFTKGSADLIIGVYEAAGVMLTGKGLYTTINELTDQSPAVRPEVLSAAVELLMNVHPVPTEATVVLSEEDKGAILAGMFAVWANLPLAMARHNYPYAIPGSIEVPLSMEYMDGTLLINGIKAGDKVVLIDDTLASGGTMVALMKAIERVGARVVDIRVVIEKLGYGGRVKVAKWTTVPIHAALGISISPEGILVVEEVAECKLTE
jgi:adenine phosphoribosyltransferase